MASFDLRIVNSIYDVPSLFVDLDMSAAALTAQPQNLAALEVLDRAPPSYRLFQGGDLARAPWWNALPASGVPVRDDTLFGNVGGYDFSAGDRHMSLSAQAGFQSPPSVSYTFSLVHDYTPNTHGTFFGNTEHGFSLGLDVGSGNIGWADSGGAHDTGVAIPNQRGHFLATFSGTGAVSIWTDGGLAYSSAAYTATHFGAAPAFDTFFAGDGTKYFQGKAGRFAFFSRALSGLELDFLSWTFAKKYALDLRGGAGSFFASYGIPNYVPAIPSDFLDPANGAISSRINAVIGRTERRYRIVRPPYQSAVHLLVLPTASDGTIDGNAGFVPAFVEWPSQGLRGEPQIVQDSVISGVCRIRLADYGHYAYSLYRPGAGTVVLHFDVSPA